MLTVVTGPPCAGKSTYVQQRAQPGDITIDLDHLAAALTPTDNEHDYPRHVAVVAIAARAAAIERALRFARTDKRVWIIHADPPSGDVWTYQQHGAQFIHLDPGVDVCVERARHRPDQARLMVALDEWYG